MSDTAPVTGPDSDADFALAKRAVDRGWLTREQVEAAMVSRDRDPGTRLLAHLPLTPERLRELQEPPSRPVPPEAAEAMKDPANRVGRYWRVAPLGSGGMGLVYRGWEPELRQWVALKFLKQIGDEQARAFFRREAQLAAALDHPNIAKIYEIGEQDGSPFIAMQFVDGETLSKAKLKTEEKLRAVAKIAEAVRCAHERKVIHRDLKPTNVMLDRNGQVFVMDFGLAKETSVEGETLTGTNVVVGTPNYMAPEQARGKATAQSDVYSIGAILYELFTGRPPFAGESSADVLTQVVTADLVWPRRLAPATPPDVEAVIIRALEKDQKRRYVDAAQMIEDLDACLNGNPLRHARRPTFAYVLGKKIRKQPLLWAFGAAMVLAIAGGAAFGTWQLLRAKREAENAARVAGEKARAEREGREQVEAEQRRTRTERDRANERLSHVYRMQARQAAGSGDDAAAAIFHVESFSAHASDPARANAVRAVRSLPGLQTILVHEQPVTMAILSPDGLWIATASKDRTARIWSASTGDPVGKPMPHSGTVQSVAFSPDSKRLATAGWDKTARIWSVPTGEPIGRELRHEGIVQCITFNPDGKRLATASWDQSARLWHSESGEPIGKEMRHAGIVWTVTFSADGRRVVTASLDGTARVWDAGTGDPIGEEMRHEKRVRAAVFSPDGKRVATASEDHTARMWETESGKPVAKEMRHGSNVDAVAFSPDGERLVSASWDKTARLWHGRTGEPIGVEMRHAFQLTVVAFSPDGNWVATGGGNAVRLWDGHSGEPIGTEMRHASNVNAVAFSPDGKWVGTASDDQTARIWDVSFLQDPTPADRLLRRAQVDTGLRLGRNEEIEVIPPEEWRALQKQLDERR
ncbi:MAG: protein kinase [Planctomycetes bacterium]|nr:protein kinase [Planctomycetota bacterium]